MVGVSKKRQIMRGQASKKWLLFTMSMGLTFIIISLIFIFVNPIVILANYQLRVANGTLVHKLLQQEIASAKLYVHLFNITNAEQFLTGKDDRLKIKEVGPFVYQEYRKNDDLEINKEPGMMRYTPNLRTELIIEESVGRPEDTFLVLPNIALLSVLQMLSKYPYFVGQVFKMLTSGMHLKPILRIDVHSFLWNNTDPLLNLVNTVVPGLMYYQSTGLLTRFYDVGAKYRLTVGTTNAEKLQVKSVKRSQDKMNSETVMENTKSYTDTYEGVAFPPQMSQTMPIKIYRYGICKTLNMRFAGTKHTEYGSQAFVYVFDNSTFSGSQLCDTKGWCPVGVMDVSSCYFGFPFAITKGHLLDTEPKMFDKIEGLKPNRSVHDATFIIDPKIGVTLEAHMSAQLNLALGSMNLLSETRRLSDMFIPVTHTIIKHPKMLEETKSSLRLLYHYGPNILIAAQALCALLGVTLLAHSAKMMYWNRVERSFEKKLLLNLAPLIDSQIK